MSRKLTTKPQRPAMPDKDKRNRFLRIRCNADEIALLDIAKGKLSRSSAMRLATFANLPAPIYIPQINQSAWSDLSRVTNNLNQLIKSMHQANRDGKDGYLLIDSVLDEVKQLKNKLIFVPFE